MSTRILISIAFILLGSYRSCCQGVSFSYLIPKNGYLTAPISPFSIRGIGIGEKTGIESGATLYNIPGLAMDDLPFDYDKPLVGPHFALMVPADIFFKIPFKKVTLKLLAGGFGWWNINPRINEGNMDRAWKAHEGWTVLNSDLELKDKIGIGWLGGVELQIPFNRDVTLTFETNYLKGSSRARLSGTYTGIAENSGILETKEVSISDAAIVLEGFEISIGGMFSIR